MLYKTIASVASSIPAAPIQRLNRGVNSPEKISTAKHYLSDCQVINNTLLSNTELTKYILQQIIGSDLPGDLSKMMQRLSDVQRQQIVGDTLLYALCNVIQRFSSFLQTFIVAQISNQGLVFVESSFEF